jgi:WD40 repeat protein
MMPGKRRTAQGGGKGSKKKGGDVTGSSPSVAGTPASHRVDALTARVAHLRARNTELTERIERDHREQAEVRVALAEAEAELEVEVLTPVANGVDPTEWLPEELLMAILIQVVTEGVCGLVCRRWYTVCQDGRVKRRAWEGRWEGYSAGWRAPQKLVGHTTIILALASGPDGTVYSGSLDGTIRAWSGIDGACLRTLPNAGMSPLSLAVGGPNGTVYAGTSAGRGGEIWGWSGTDGSRLAALEGHPGHDVHALAIAVDGNLVSGASDRTIRVWSNGEHVRTLIGHTDDITALAIGTKNRLYSGSHDMTVRVWSVARGTHLCTLEGHTSSVVTVAVGPDGTVYSGSDDKTIRVWSADDGRPLRTLLGHTDCLLSIAIDSGGTIFSSSTDQTIRVWCGETGNCRYVLKVPSSFWAQLVIGSDNKLYTPTLSLDQSGWMIGVW